MSEVAMFGLYLIVGGGGLGLLLGFALRLIGRR